MFEVLFLYIMIKYSSSSDDELTAASKLYLISSSGRRYSAHPINIRLATDNIIRKRSWCWADQSQNSTQEAQRSRIKSWGAEWRVMSELPAWTATIKYMGLFYICQLLEWRGRSDERWVRSDPLGMFVPLDGHWIFGHSRMEGNRRMCWHSQVDEHPLMDTIG
jgi:hypothetical protein